MPRLWLAMVLLLGACRDSPPSQASSPARERSNTGEAGSVSAAANTRTDRDGVPSAERDPTGAASNAAPPVRRDNTIYAEAEQMGTRVSINVWLPRDRTPTEAGAAIEAAFGEIERIEDIMSEWRENSELSRLNRATEAMRLSDELFEVLDRSKQVHLASHGAFDVTFHAVGELWTFRPGAKPPSDAAIAQRLPLVDSGALELDPARKTARFRRAGMKIGLGAIAKGYAVDRASQLLARRGFVDHIVEGGGDTFVSGSKGGKPWMVGVQAPGRNGTIGALAASNEGVVTSGDYQRFFVYEGQRYAHILDPRTGHPIPEARSCQSVTVVAPDATTADAFATAVAVLGIDDGMKLIEERPELEAILIGPTGEVRVSTGLQERFLPTAASRPANAASRAAPAPTPRSSPVAKPISPRAPE